MIGCKPVHFIEGVLSNEMDWTCGQRVRNYENYWVLAKSRKLKNIWKGKTQMTLALIAREDQGWALGYGLAKPYPQFTTI